VNEQDRNGRKTLTEPEARAFLSARGIPMPAHAVAATAEEAVAAAETIGYPVVMKVVSPRIVHKSEVNGVRVNLASAGDVRQAFGQLAAIRLPAGGDAEIRGCLVTAQVRGGLEVIVGSTRDRQFGPVVMFGLGGIFVEVYADVSFGIAPLRPSEARAMISRIKGFPLLQGTRGGKPRDTEALAHLLVEVSELVWREQSILELDLNPVFALEQGVAVGDARILQKG
jgi:acyl-CoA synthetase (NDP forming)